ncbi:scavenger receptor class F member 1-like isoform X2 [Branchiostoma floridae]|uniref:Scavenger receptor class F member 1-like isoform X2 n=1 Tax=Branchiostoma floridae TaxID=7739 RepID=A0A9J7LS93_BRAFL|nr:scavenger receptor class F member 1-like isoform X2 [Branchiostoma floridae]
MHMYNSRDNGGSGDTNNKKVSCFGFVMTYNEATGVFSVTPQDQEASKQVLGNLPRNYANWKVARAEYVSPLEHSQAKGRSLASIVEAPCTVKWSNSYQIKPAEEGGRCLYFVAASSGDIFVVFSVIPRDKSTWYHLQISFQGVALYKGMKLVKYEGAKSARSLGDSKLLFQPYFICLEEDHEKQRTYIKYGIGSDTSEKGLVYMVYNDAGPPLGIRFYSFGGGEKDVEIMDARIIEGGAQGEMECTGGTVLKDGKCVEDCHPECNGCIPMSSGSKLNTECRSCKHFSIHKRGGTIQCVAKCPVDMKAADDGVTCRCKDFVFHNDDGSSRCVSACGIAYALGSDGRTCTVKFRADARCGTNFPAPGASPGQCNPYSDGPCCSSGGWCGATEAHCTCNGCKDYRKWRADSRCGADFPAPGANPGQCDPKSDRPCCSTEGWCGASAAHCTCDGCKDFRPAKWRADSRCGADFSAPGANPSQCDPLSDRPCCSTEGWCGATAAHCTCDGCKDFRPVKWRADHRCGTRFPAPGANPGQCNPKSDWPCCSSGGWCGSTPTHCTCDDCRDYRLALWRDDGRCGTDFQASGANPGQCDPKSERPCCSTEGWCGASPAHCTCHGCKDYRLGTAKFRADGRCGTEFPAPGANPGQCNPVSDRPCCSKYGWCGATSAHCTCDDCMDYRPGMALLSSHNVVLKRYRVMML